MRVDVGVFFKQPLYNHIMSFDRSCMQRVAVPSALRVDVDAPLEQPLQDCIVPSEDFIDIVVRTWCFDW